MPSLPDLRAVCSLLLPVLLCAACATRPDPTSRLESVAVLSQGPGNIAVTPDGRLIISQHPIYQPEIRVVELVEDIDVTHG